MARRRNALRPRRSHQPDEHRKHHDDRDISENQTHAYMSKYGTSLEAVPDMLARKSPSVRA